MVTQGGLNDQSISITVPGVRNRGPAEKKRIVVSIDNNLGKVRILKFILGNEGAGQRSHADRRVVEQYRAFVYEYRRQQGFVPLQVDDREVIGPVLLLTNLGYALRARCMVGACHTDICAEFMGCSFDALIVGGDPHFVRLALQRQAMDMLNHRLPRDRTQNLAWQPHGGITCRDDDHEFIHFSCITAAFGPFA